MKKKYRIIYEPEKTYMYTIESSKSYWFFKFPQKWKVENHFLNLEECRNWIKKDIDPNSCKSILWTSEDNYTLQNLFCNLSQQQKEQVE